MRDLILLLAAEERDPESGVDTEHARLMAALLWTLGAAIAIVLLPFAPPTAEIGAPGWVAAAAMLAGCAYPISRRIGKRNRFTFREAWLTGGVALVAIGVLQWLAGPGAPFHYLYVLPVVHVAAVHPRGRALSFLAIALLAVCAPLVYAPHRTTTYEIVAQVVLLLALGGASRIIFVALRSQRHALQEAQRRAERLARVDPLTGLGNRRAFEESIRLEVARGVRRGGALSLIVADVDGFKRINDRFGHLHGDEYLRSVATVLDQNGRAGDQCFRWGGDEFVVLMPETERTEAEVVSARLARAIESAAPLALGSERVELTFGVAQLGAGESGDDLLAAADAMLLARKRRKLLTPSTAADTSTAPVQSLVATPIEAPPLQLRSPRRRYTDQRLFGAIACIVAATLVYLAVLMLAGADLGTALPLVVVSTGAAAAALGAWQRDRAAAIAAVQSQQRDAVRSARLARRIVALHDAADAEDPDEVGSLVARVAVNLLDARKGLLLTRAEPSHGGLELSGSVGFGAKLDDLPRLKQLAEHALADDKTVRVNQVSKGDLSAQIHNLVAIPLYTQQISCGVVICANRDGGFDDLEDGILLSLGDHAGSALQNGRLRAAARRSHLDTAKMLLEAIRVNDPSLGGHSIEVSTYVGRVAEALGLDSRHRERLIFGSMLHDIGKLGISEQILLKPEPLTPEERRVVQTHPAIGARLVEQVDALRELADGILHHHERIDGTGYPDGLAADGISFDARVIAVADSFSAMTSRRPYGNPMTVERACAELERGSGTQFDPRVVNAFVEQVRRDPRPRPRRPALADLRT